MSYVDEAIAAAVLAAWDVMNVEWRGVGGSARGWR